MPEGRETDSEKETSGLRNFLFGNITRKLILLVLITAVLTVSVVIIAEMYVPVHTAVIPSLLIAFFMAFLISGSVSGPVIELYNMAREIEKGNLKARADIKTNDEIKQLGMTLNKMAERLVDVEKEHKELDDAKTTFLSISSHELRSPMTPMKAQLQMMEKGYFGKLNKKQKEALEIVLRNTTRLDSLISDLLELSRIEAARLKFNFIKTDLTPYINRLIKEMDGFWPDKKIKIIANIEKPPVIEVDPDRVMQVLRNLLNNAKKFSPSKSKIVLNVERKGNFIQFTVKDEGIGISPETQEKLFQPFSQAEQSLYRTYGGTGLGLVICKGIVESQGGKIWLESQLGKGTTFYFTFPLIPIKEIKPIKLTFVSADIKKRRLEEIFREILGPIGKTEFDELDQRNKLSQEKLFKYTDYLINNKIISEIKGNWFKTSIANIIKNPAEDIESEGQQ